LALPDLSHGVLLTRGGAVSARDESREERLKRAADVFAGRVPCLECGDNGPHEDNGDRQDLTYLCKCGNQFDAPGVGP
jgi:hypothetical protein